jgi:hypothetical protein
MKIGSDHRGDPERTLNSALGEMRGDLPSVDWESLRHSIRQRAAPELERRRKVRVLRWARPLVPLAAAASVAMALWFGQGLLDTAEGTFHAIAGLEGDELLVEAMIADLSEQEFEMLILGRANPGALLSFAVDQR